jgi:hypothetical protein
VIHFEIGRSPMIQFYRPTNIYKYGCADLEYSALLTNVATLFGSSWLGARFFKGGARPFWRRRYADVVPTFDEICRRSLNFIVKCRNSDLQLVRFIVNFGLEYLSVNFSVPRNAIFCSLRYAR